MEHSEKPMWMSDPLVAEIPAEKLDFLSKLFAESQGKSQTRLMSSLMTMMKKAKKENLVLTPREMNLAIAAIKRNSSADELKKIDELLEKAGKKKDLS